jgi:hypothetical protein
MSQTPPPCGRRAPRDISPFSRGEIAGMAPNLGIGRVVGVDFVSALAPTVSV